ncbi:MAG: hypothetical protein JO332_14520 [Planctomycetaceae bacterium]|nr:hypothetical protein [Planctomycetaceae bacterium]
MIDNALLKRLLILAAALLVISAGAAVALGAPLSFAGGMGLGFLLGAVPLASWAWVAPRILMGRSRGLAVLLLALKLGFYAAALYVGVYRNLVSPVGVLVGMTTVGAVLILGILLKAPAPAKEAA